MSTMLDFPQNTGVGGLDHHFPKEEQRPVKSDKKGNCNRCGIKTHKSKLGRKTPITDQHVHSGRCIKCDPDKIPLNVVLEWEEKFPDYVAVARRTILHSHRGSERQNSSAPSSDAGGAQDRCVTCGIQTHELKASKQKRPSLLGRKKMRAPQLVPLNIPGAVLAGRCLLCHPLPGKVSIHWGEGHRSSREESDDGGSSVPRIVATNAANATATERTASTANMVAGSSHSDWDDIEAEQREHQRRSLAEVEIAYTPTKEIQYEPNEISYTPDNLRVVNTTAPFVEPEAAVEMPVPVSEDTSGTDNAEEYHDVETYHETETIHETETMGGIETHVTKTTPSEARNYGRLVLAKCLDLGSGHQKEKEEANVPKSIQVEPQDQWVEVPVPAGGQEGSMSSPESRVNDDEEEVDEDAAAVKEHLKGAVPKVINVDPESEDYEEIDNDDRANWQAPWPLIRNENHDDGDDSSNDDNGGQAAMDDEYSAVSSLNFSTAEEFILDHSVTDRSVSGHDRSFSGHDRSMADSSLRRGTGVKRVSSRGCPSMRASMHSKAGGRSARRASKAGSLSGRSYRSDRSQTDRSVTDRSISEQSFTERSQVSVGFNASSNSLMAMMPIQTEELATWIQDFGDQCRESEQFRAEAVDKGGIAAVISAMKVHKVNTSIQQLGASAMYALARDHGASIAKQGGVSCFLSAMKYHGQDDPQVQEHACGALMYSVVNDSYKGTVARKGGVPLILTAMDRHIDQLPVQQQSFACLLRLSSHKDIVDALAYNGIRTIVESMKKHNDNVLLQQFGAGILKNIAQQKETSRITIVSEGGAAAIVAASKWHLVAENLQVQACWALYEISATEDIAKEGAIGAMISTMQTHKENAKIQHYGCGVLKNLSITKKNIYTVAKQKGIAPILDAMQNHLENAALQRCACGALKHLSLSNTNERHIAKMGGIMAVVEAMKAHKLDGTVQREACGAMRNLSINENNKGLIAQHGGVVTILMAMKLNTHDASLQQKACGALLNLSSNSELRRSIAKRGGVVAVIAVMKHLSNDAKVQQYVCGTLKNLAVSSELKKSIGSQDAIPSILAAMKRHPDDARVVSSAVGALKNLAGTAENKAEIAKNKGIIALVTAMREHESEPSVQQEGSAALLGLSAIKENSVSIGRYGGIHAILNGMKKNYKKASVQSSAFGALWSLSCSSANLSTIQKNSGVSLICSGMKRHTTVSGVQHKGCLALGNMTSNAEARAQILDHGGITAAIDAMKSHVSDVQVQKYGCKLLASMLKTEEEIEEVEKGMGAVIIALENHNANKDLFNYAHKIMSKVQGGGEGESTRVVGLASGTN